MTKITDKDVMSATANGDGTHNGYKLAQWLYEATTGRPLSDADAVELVKKAQEEGRRRAARRVQP